MSRGWVGSDDLALDAPTLVAGGSYQTILDSIGSARLKPGPGCAIARDKGGNPVSLVLVVLGSEGAEEGIHAIAGSRCVIGRGADCDLDPGFPEPNGPRLVVAEEDQRSFVACLGAAEVRLNGRRLSEKLKTLVLPGDEIETDGLVLAVRDEADSSEGTAALARHLSEEMLKGTDPGAVGPILLVMNGPKEGTAIALPGHRGQLVIGRGESCDLQIEDADASRKHARLSWRDGAFEVEDLKSRNGTLVNGGRTGGKTPLSDRDDLTLGQTRLELVLPRIEEPAEPTALADFEPTEGRTPPMDAGAADLAAAPARRSSAGDWLLVGLGLALAAGAVALLVWALS